MKKSSVWVMIVILMVLVALVGYALFAYYNDAKNQIAQAEQQKAYYKQTTTNINAWLATTALPNGALATTPVTTGYASVIPYFACLSTTTLLQDANNSQNIATVKAYLDWHFAHLNKTKDADGLTGTIYNYDILMEDGQIVKEKTNANYDSVDSYAAVFLTALLNYYDATGDEAYIKNHKDDILLVTGTLLSTIMGDGLSVAKPASGVKYTMDNIEVLRGLNDAEQLLSNILGLQNAQTMRLHSQVVAAKTKLASAIEAKLWNETDMRYEIGLSKSGKVITFDGWEDFYPNAVVQIFPTAFGALPASSERAEALYQAFKAHYNWAELDYYTSGATSHYWGITAYVGALMGDEDGVKAYFNYISNNVAPTYAPPAFSTDMAWIVLAGYEMVDFYNKRIESIDPFGWVRKISQ